MCFRWCEDASERCPDDVRIHEFTVPITFSYMGLRMGEHSLELGGGATILIASDYDFGALFWGYLSFGAAF